RIVRTRRCIAGLRRGHALALGVLNDEIHRCGESAPVTFFFLQCCPALLGQGVELGVTAEIRLRPRGFDPTLLLEPMEGWVQGTLLHLQRIVREELDALGDSPAMQWLACDHAHDEESKRT